MMTKRVDPRVMAEAIGAAAKVIGADWDDPDYWVPCRGRWRVKVADAAPPPAKPARPPASLTDRSKLIRDFVDEYWRRRRRRRKALDQLSEQAWSTGAKREDAQRRAKDWEPAGGWPAPRPVGYAGSGIDNRQYQRILDEYYGKTMKGGLLEDVEGEPRHHGQTRSTIKEEAPDKVGPYEWPPQKQPYRLEDENNSLPYTWKPSKSQSTQDQFAVLAALNRLHRSRTASGFYGLGGGLR